MIQIFAGYLRILPKNTLISYIFQLLTVYLEFWKNFVHEWILKTVDFLIS